MADPSSTSAAGDHVPPRHPVAGSLPAAEESGQKIPSTAPPGPAAPGVAAPTPAAPRADALGPVSPSPVSSSPGLGSPDPAASGDVADLQMDPQGTVISKRRPLSPVSAAGVGSPIEMGVVLEGETLGHFHLEKFVGGGGMGAVFRATDSMLDRTVAVKVLSRGHSEPKLLRRFKNEAQSAARLDHENIARVHYVGEDKGWNYIVFEYIEGLNIRQMVAQKGPLPLGEAISYTLQVAEAIEHAYRRDVVHRDIKPSNVLITADGHVKLVDMGLARLHQVEAPERDLTASGVTLGTFDYISPEQARDPRSADVRSDLYSLGCTLYFMLTGHAPFPEGTVLQKLLSHTSDERPDPRAKRPDLPDEVIEVLDRMLARHPQDRYQRPSELIGELLLMADQLGLHEAGRGTVWITPGRERPRWIEYVVPIAVPLLSLVAVIFALDRFWPAPQADIARPHPKLLSSIEEQTDQSQRRDLQPAENVDRQQTATEPDGSLSGGDAPSAISSEVPAGDSGAAQFTERGSTADALAGDGDVGLDARIGPPAVEAELNLAGPDDDLSAELNPEAATLEQISTSEVDENDAPSGGLPSGIIERLIVGDPGISERGALVVDSLSTAIQQASELSGVTTIELWFNGPSKLDPTVIAAEDLTIKAGPGFAPELVFTPTEREFASDGRMIRIHGGHTVWDGIHFWFNPAAESDGWSLFHLDQITSLELRDCTMTITNGDSLGGTLYQRVSFFEIAEPPRAETMGGAWEFAMDEPVIKMDRCVARGEATLISAERATPLRLNWNQGLFVTTQRLVEMDGAIFKPAWHSQIVIELTNVTARMPEGMCRLSARLDAPYQIYLDVSCIECILIPGSDTALIQHDHVGGGLQNGVGLEDYMEIRGQFCFFPDRTTVWRIVPLTDEDPTLEFDLGSTGDWFALKRPNRIVESMWSRVPDIAKSAHLQTPDNYQLDKSLLQNPAIGQSETAGFEVLPEFPRNGQAPTMMTPLPRDDFPDAVSN